MGEEIANSVLHGIGVLLAVAGLVLLTLKGAGYLPASRGGSLAVVSYVIFTAGMIVMFLMSTLYHAIQHIKAKNVFRILDHGAIYLFIAGTYTPFCLLALGGTLGWVLFSLEWVFAATGIILYSVNFKYIKKIEIGLYVFMGWAIVFGISRLFSSIPLVSFILLFSGGLAYTLGIIWYVRKKSRGSHTVWHIFVLSGAAMHWFSVWFM